jgi:hypothetical protein
MPTRKTTSKAPSNVSSSTQDDASQAPLIKKNKSNQPIEEPITQTRKAPLAKPEEIEEIEDEYEEINLPTDNQTDEALSTVNQIIDKRFFEQNVDDEQFRVMSLNREDTISSDFVVQVNQNAQPAEGFAIVQEYKEDNVKGRNDIFNRIHFDHLSGFLTALRQYLNGKSDSSEIRSVISEIENFLNKREWQEQGDKRLSEAQEHLIVRDLFDDLRDSLTKRGDSRSQKKYLKLLFKTLKAYHLAAAAPSILQAYIDKALAKNEKYSPSFTQAIPSATISSSKGVTVKGGAGVGTGPISAKLVGTVGVSQGKTKNIAMDSAYSVQRDITVSAGFQAAGNLAVPGLASLSFSGKATGSVTVLNYQEQTAIANFILMNFTNKHAWFGQYMSGKTGRTVASGTRRASNWIRRARGIPTVVRTAPYFLTQSKVYLGSGSQRFLLDIAQRIDQEFGVKAEQGSLRQLIATYYPIQANPLMKADGTLNSGLVSDMNKAYGALVDSTLTLKDISPSVRKAALGWFHPTDLRTHQSGYAGRYYAGDLSFDFSFNVGVGADAGLSFYGEGPSTPESQGGPLAGEAGHKDSQSKKLASVVPNLVKIAAHLDAGISWLLVPVGVNTTLTDAFNVHDKSMGAARRAMTQVFETLIDNRVLENKTSLLAPSYQAEIKSLKTAVEKDRTTAAKDKNASDLDYSDVRDRKQLKHGSQHVKTYLRALVGRVTPELIRENLTHLQNQLQQFYQDHLELKRLQFLLIKEPEFFGTHEEMENRIRNHIGQMINRYWGVTDTRSDSYQKLMDDALNGDDLEEGIKDKLKNVFSIKNPSGNRAELGQAFMAKTLDNFDLCLAFVGMSMVSSWVGNKNVPNQTVQLFNDLKKIINGDSFEVDKKTLRAYSSVMFATHINDLRYAANGSLTFEGPSLGLLGKAFSNVPLNGNNTVGGGFDSSSTAGITGKFRFEIYDRYDFPNAVRKGLFIKIVVGASLGGVAAYLPYVVYKWIQTLKSHPTYQNAAKGALSKLDSTLNAAAQLLINPQVFNPSLGFGAEMIFRVSAQRGWEWLNTKYFTSHGSDFGFGDGINLLTAVPGANLSLSFSDSRKVTEINQYRLGNGYMSHFTTWRREVNSADGQHHNSAQTVFKGLYAEDEWNQVDRIGAEQSDARINERKAQLSMYRLDVELFSNDCVAWIIQRYLNCYSDRSAPVTVLHSRFGDDGNAGQLGWFFGGRARRKFIDAANALRTRAQKRVAADPREDGLAFNEPTQQQRAEMLTLLRRYAEQQHQDPNLETKDDLAKLNPKRIARKVAESYGTSDGSKKDELKDRMDFYLRTAEGRKMLAFYFKILDAANNLVRYTQKDDYMCYTATIDGVPGSATRAKAEKTDDRKKALKDQLEAIKKSALPAPVVDEEDDNEFLPEDFPEDQMREGETKMGTYQGKKTKITMV